jgi:hypothetical protein
MRLLGSRLSLVLVTAAFSTAAVTAQQLPRATQGIASPLFSMHAEYLSLAEYHASSVFENSAQLNYPHNLALNWLQTSTPPPKPAKPPVEKIKRTAIDPSMVGYIEDAGIHSEFRIRFDAAWDDETPDRAEFFYAKCGCYANPAAGANFDPNTPGPGPGIPKDVNFQQLYFYGEYAPTPRISVFLQFPFRWLQPQSLPGAPPAFPNSSGFGDMPIGIKFAPIASDRRHLTLQFKTILPSGNAHSGLGTNHATIEPSILYYERLSERLTIEAEFGDAHPLGSSAGLPTTSSKGFAGDVLFYGAGPSYQFINDEQFRLAGVLEFVGWNIRNGFVTGPANPSTAGVNIVNAKVGPRMLFGSHHSFYAGYGIALTSAKWYREIFRTEYRYAF